MSEKGFAIRKASLVISLSFVLLVLGGGLLFGGDASLLIYPLDDPVYGWIEDLYLLEGKAMPNQAKPWTELDIANLLDRISPSSEATKRLYEIIDSTILKKKGVFSGYLDVYLDLGLMLHSNPSEFSSYDRIAGRTSEVNFYPLGLDLYGTVNDNLALFFDFSLGPMGTYAQKLAYNDKGIITGVIPYNLSTGNNSYGEFWQTNIPYLPIAGINTDWSPRNYLVAGYEMLRVMAARERISWGPGMMGNLLLGDTLPWHNFVSFDLTGVDWFKYTMLVDFYSFMGNFVGDDTNDASPKSGVRFMVAHRFAFSVLDGRLNFALNDAVMHASSSGYVNPLLFLPLNFLHTVYNAGDNNNLMTIEIKWAPFEHFSLFAEAAIDDIRMPWEADSSGRVDGWGVSGGARGALSYGPGIFRLGAEFVYTNPYIYHKSASIYFDKTNDKSAQEQYFVSSIPYDSYTSPETGIFQYLSYRFGSDSIASLLTLTYEVPDLWDATFDAFFMAHGVIGKLTTVESWNLGEEKEMGETPSTFNPFTGERGKVEYTMVFGAKGHYNPYKWLKLGASLYWFGVINDNNEKSPLRGDIQFGLSLKFIY